MYGQDREAEYKRLIEIYSAYIPTDEALQQPISTLKGVIDITYYQSKKETIKGRYNINTGMLMLSNGTAFIWDKQKVIH